jgi:protein-tyrosine phosphatase
MPQIVLFVCTGNYYRSRYAEELFNAWKPSALDWRADSRGFALWPGNIGPISPETKRRLNAAGIALPEPIRAPATLLEADLHAAARVIALDRTEHAPYVDDLFPAWRARFEYWDVADLHLSSVDDALGAIEMQVRALLMGMAD